MNDLSELERLLTDQLLARAADASPPADAWRHIVAGLSTESSAGIFVDHETPSTVPDAEGNDGELGGSTSRWPVVILAAAAAVIAVVLWLQSSGDERGQDIIFTDDQEQPAEQDPEQEDSQPPNEGGSSDETAATVTGSVQLDWSSIDSVTPSKATASFGGVVSDGQSFFALVAGEESSELSVSSNGTEWRKVADVPFTHIDAVSEGKIVSMEVGDRPFPSSPVEFSIRVVKADGLLSETSAFLTIPEAEAALVSHIDASVNFLGTDGVVITGSYFFAHDLVKGAGLGLTTEELVALRAGQDDADSMAPVLAEALGISVNEFEEETDLNEMALRLGLTELPMGVAGVDLPIAFQIATLDGVEWSDVTESQYGYDVTNTGTALVGHILYDDLRQKLSISSDGASWAEVIDPVTGSPLPEGGRLVPGSDRALYVTSSTVWVVAADGATKLVADGTELENIDLDSVENNIGSLSIGHAGVAYLTGFTEGDSNEFHGPTAIVFSTDYETWTRLSLPEEVIASQIDFRDVRLSVGRDGFLLAGHKLSWFGTLSPR